MPEEPEVQEVKAVEEVLTEFVTANATEIAAEEGKKFELVGATIEESSEVVAPVAAPAPEAAAAKPEEKAERISPLQKIARLTVGERVKLAMLGNKEERAILVRDGSRIVSSAVLASPKITDQEVETFAALKNVQESVLRDISRSRKYMKRYSVMRNLVNNPRCPLDISLNLMKQLMAQDLKMLSLNKGVPETLKRTALRNFKEKTTPGGKA